MARTPSQGHITPVHYDSNLDEFLYLETPATDDRGNLICPNCGSHDLVESGGLDTFTPGFAPEAEPVRTECQDCTYVNYDE